ncbi:integrase, catalytic region, zinc finger, CCHC-type containing protein [Tanacetum coccineum]
MVMESKTLLSKFDYINLLSKKDVVIGLRSSCEVSKAKQSSFKSKTIPSLKGRLNFLHMDLCGPMRVASINGKIYILVIVDDYSRYTWTLFLRSKDETLEALKDFLTMIQRNLQALVISVRTDRGIEFLNKLKSRSSGRFQMHNNIMAAGSRDHPPMLATGRYAQWRSWFLRYIDTKPNGDALRKYILKGPYTPTIVITSVVPATEDSPAVPEQTTVETVMNMTPEYRAHFESEKEAIHLILTGIRDEIYSTVDSCQTAQEMWEAIERLQQGE